MGETEENQGKFLCAKKSRKIFLFLTKNIGLYILLANILYLSHSRRKKENRGRKWKERRLVESSRAASSNGQRCADSSARLAVVGVKHLARHGQCRLVVGSTTVHSAFSFAAVAPRFRQSHLKEALGERILFFTVSFITFFHTVFEKTFQTI